MPNLSNDGLAYLIKELKTYYNVKYKVFAGHNHLPAEMAQRYPTKWPQDPKLGEIMTVYTPVDGAILTRDYMYVGNTTGFKLSEGETNTTTINRWFEGSDRAWLPIRPNIGTW